MQRLSYYVYCKLQIASLFCTPKYNLVHLKNSVNYQSFNTSGDENDSYSQKKWSIHDWEFFKLVLLKVNKIYCGVLDREEKLSCCRTHRAVLDSIHCHNMNWSSLQRQRLIGFTHSGNFRPHCFGSTAKSMQSWFEWYWTKPAYLLWGWDSVIKHMVSR